ncbi:MAG TPA: NfeD family protein [Candidatus Amulumruptor caecigallinarius]|uniref:NfeD family protein n=1 Tax=Candidatus Amulumruptor caecigallinarius TaxID=2109911 RepID=A0A921E8D8_9BACT|nr:NfeD family protein [Candidatus Amulumruptor caecigallinarius]
METWIIWLTVAAALIIIELLTQWIATFCIAIGCIAAMIAYLCGAPMAWQLVWLATGTIGGFVCFIPLFKRRIERKRHASGTAEASNMDAMLGRKAKVIVAIPADGLGRVKLDGDNWQAQCDTPVEVGVEVTVTGYDSIILQVAPSDESAG